MVLYQPALILTHRQRPNAVMPTEVGIHDFAVLDRRKAWVPTCVGMTGNGGRYVIHFTGRHYKHCVAAHSSFGWAWHLNDPTRSRSVAVSLHGTKRVALAAQGHRRRSDRHGPRGRTIHDFPSVINEVVGGGPEPVLGRAKPDPWARHDDSGAAEEATSTAPGIRRRPGWTASAAAQAPDYGPGSKVRRRKAPVIIMRAGTPAGEIRASRDFLHNSGFGMSGTLQPPDQKSRHTTLWCVSKFNWPISVVSFLEMLEKTNQKPLTSP